MEATDIIKVINGAGFVAVPFLGALFGLDWYFSRGGKSTKWVFICVGGILSAVLYSYLAWTEPSSPLIKTSILWYLCLAAVAVAIYYGLHLAYDGSDGKPLPLWVLPAALLCYVFLLSAIGVFCAAALARHDYLLLSGTVYSGTTPVTNAELILQDANRAPLRQTITDRRGRFLLSLRYKDYIAKPDDEKPAHLLIKTEGFVEEERDLDGHPNENLQLSLTPIPPT